MKTQPTQRLLLGTTLVAVISAVAVSAARPAAASPSWPSHAVVAYKCADSLCLIGEATNEPAYRLIQILTRLRGGVRL